MAIDKGHAAPDWRLAERRARRLEFLADVFVFALLAGLGYAYLQGRYVTAFHSLLLAIGIATVASVGGLAIYLRLPRLERITIEDRGVVVTRNWGAPRVLTWQDWSHQKARLRILTSTKNGYGLLPGSQIVLSVPLFQTWFYIPEPACNEIRKRARDAGLSEEASDWPAGSVTTSRRIGSEIRFRERSGVGR